MVLEQNPEFVCVKLDFRNAFNEMRRSRVIEVLEKEDSLRHLAVSAGVFLAASSGLESRGEMWGSSEEGLAQGDPGSGPWFAIGLQEDVVAADRALQQAGGMARAGWDDGYFIGPKDTVNRVLEEFSGNVFDKCGLTLQRTKSEFYSARQEVDIPPDFIKAGCTDSGGQFQPGFICYGVPIGTDTYVKEMLGKKINEIEGEADKIFKTDSARVPIADPH